jgi:hypothetical protein
MQDQRQVHRRLRVEYEQRPRARDPVVVGSADEHLLVHQLHHISALHAGPGEERVGLCQRLEAAGEARYKIGRALGANQRLVCDRLHRRERVLDAMRQLVAQDALQFLGPLAVRDVAADLRCADHLSRTVAQGGYGQRYVDAAAILGNAHGLVMLDAFAALQPRQDLLLFAVQFVRDDAQDRLADHLARAVTEDARGAGVPRGDAAIDGLADDRVVR